MNEERINELLLKTKEVYEQGGDKEDIYDLLLNTTYEIVPFSRYIPIQRYPDEVEKIAKKLDIPYEELNKKITKAQFDLYYRGVDDTGISTLTIEKKIREKLYEESKDSIYLMPFKRDAFGHRPICDSQFVKTRLTKRFASDTKMVKLYFNITPDLNTITDFCCDLIDFVKDEEIDVYCKSRYDDSSDMVTFRFSNIEKFDKVVNFINKYKINNQNSNPLIPTFNGIGYTIDNGKSYNDFLSKQLYDYVSLTDAVNINSFKEYINKKQLQSYSDCDLKEKETNILFYNNLNKALNESEFNIGKFIDDFNNFAESQENIKEMH